MVDGLLFSMLKVLIPVVTRCFYGFSAYGRPMGCADDSDPVIAIYIDVRVFIDRTRSLMMASRLPERSTEWTQVFMCCACCPTMGRRGSCLPIDQVIFRSIGKNDHIHHPAGTAGGGSRRDRDA